MTSLSIAAVSTLVSRPASLSAARVRADIASMVTLRVSAQEACKTQSYALHSLSRSAPLRLARAATDHTSSPM